jgi:DNA-binding transcriptional LysR family regulator
VRSDWLESFIAFAERLNFTRAAEALHISQPALHVQVSKLAEQVGAPLYLRRGRQLVLTEIGGRLLAFARESKERSQQFLDQLRGGGAGHPVTLAAGTGAFLYLLGPGIREFMRTTGTPVRLLQRDRAGTLEAVRTAEAHLGVAAWDAAPDDVDAELLVRVPQVVVVPKNHRLARKRPVRLADLSAEALIVPPANHPQRTSLAHAFAFAGISWSIAVEATGWELVIRFVEFGVGITIVNGCCRIPQGLVARPVQGLPDVAYFIVKRAETQLGPESARLRRSLIDRVPSADR